MRLAFGISRRGLILVALAALAIGLGAVANGLVHASAATPATPAAPTRSARVPAASRTPLATAGTKTGIRHVFIIVLENESASTTFGPGTPAPYLATTMKSEGAYLPNYYGVGHHSLDNYIAMISGQAPNAQTEADCGTFAPFTPGTIGADGQAVGSGCVYPANVPTIVSQLSAAHITWRDYNEDMGADPSRESATCGHPVVGQPDNTEVATATDMYATRHDPFVYFDSIIDNPSLCNSHVVNLDDLPGDLSKLSSTADYTFITPDLCDDGHDAPCADGEPGGLAQVNTFLSHWVPKITASQAFREDGLLLVTFDEAATTDASSCCGEIPGPNSALPGGTGPGGGQVGAVLLSPCIAPGTVTETPYNHYTMLGSVENLLGLKHIGYAGLPGETYFGSDIFNRPCGPAPPVVMPRSAAFGASHGARARVTVSWRVSTQGGTALASVEVQERAGKRGAWRTLTAATRRSSVATVLPKDVTYYFRIRGTDVAGEVGPWSTIRLTAAG